MPLVRLETTYQI